MNWLRDLIHRILTARLRLLALVTAEGVLVGRRLESGAFVHARAFAAGEPLWLDPRALDLIPAGTQADVIVCQERSRGEWLAGGPPASAILSRVTLSASATRAPIQLLSSLPAGRFDILLDLRRDGAFDPGDAIEGGSGPGIVVLDDPALPGPYQTTDTPLDLGVVSVVDGSGPAVDAPLLVEVIAPVGATPGPVAFLLHGNGYDPRHTRPLGRLLATWGITAIVTDHSRTHFGGARIALAYAARERLRGLALARGLDLARPLWIGHSVGGGCCAEIAFAAEAVLPSAGLCLLAAADPGTRPLVATPLLAMVGTNDGFGLSPIPGYNTGLVGHTGMWTADAAQYVRGEVVVEGAYHGDFTYPDADTLDNAAPVIVSERADKRRYVAGMACAFARRWLLDETATDVFLVDGLRAVPTAGSRVASRPPRDQRTTLEDGRLAMSPARSSVDAASVFAARAVTVDCNTSDPGYALALRCDAVGAGVRWLVPAGVTATALSLHVAQIVDRPVKVSMSSSDDVPPAVAALDAGTTTDAFRFQLAALGIAPARVSVIERGARWSLHTTVGRDYTLTPLDRWSLGLVSDRPANVPTRTIPFAVQLVDRSGRSSSVELRVPPAPQDDGQLPISAYTGFYLPLDAFDIDPRAIASVSIRGLDPAGCQLAIDNVELVS